MAVVLGAVVAVGGFALAHGDYSDYGDYAGELEKLLDEDDYDDDLEELMRMENLRAETESAAHILSEYKSESVNPELSSQSLKEESAMKVSEAAMDKDVKSSIEKKIDNETLQGTETLQMELQRIDELLGKIEKIERGQ